MALAADALQDSQLQPRQQPPMPQGALGGFWLLGSLGIGTTSSQAGLEAGMQPWRPPALQRAGESQLLCQGRGPSGAVARTGG